MITYFANRKMKMLGLSSTNLPDGYKIVDDEKTEDTETGVASFECVISYTLENRSVLEDMTTEGNFILRSNGDENEFYTIIDKDSSTKDMEITVYAEDAGLDLLNDLAEAYEATEAHTIAWYFSRWIAGSGFEIGINEIPDLSRTLKWDSETTVTERLASIATQFDNAEVSYSFATKGLTVTKMYVNIQKKRGKDVQDQLRLNKDINNITRKTSVKNLATAYSVTGGTPEGKDVAITLKGYSYDDGDIYVNASGLLCSRSALKKWGRYPDYSTHIVKAYSYDTTSQATLCAHAVTALKKVYDAELNFEIDINKLPAGIGVGDRINIVDERGELFLSSRILKLVTSITGKKQTATLGEYMLKSSGISDQVQDLAEKFSKLSTGRTLYTWMAYADDAAGTGISTDPTGKTFLGIAANRTTETPDITDPSVYTWTVIQDTGSAIISMLISSSAGTLFKTGLVDTVLTAHVYASGVELSDEAIAGIGTISWYQDGGSTAVATGKTLTVSNIDAVSYCARLEA